MTLKIIPLHVDQASWERTQKARIFAKLMMEGKVKSGMIAIMSGVLPSSIFTNR